MSDTIPNDCMSAGTAEEYADALHEFGGEYTYTHANFTPEKNEDTY